MIVRGVSGRILDTDDPRPEDVDLESIAWALSNICRWGGQTRRIVTVAQHSCVVSDFLAATGAPGHVVRAGLLHDAGEAYVGDLKSPLRTPKFDRIEAGVLRAVGERFGVELDPMYPAVRDVDYRSRRQEAEQLISRSFAEQVVPGVEPIPGPIEPWGRRRSRAELLRRCRELGIG